MAVSPFEYEYLRRFVKAHSGLALGASRQAAEHRLGIVVRCAGLADIAGLVLRLRAGDDALAARVIEAMTNRETWFFRDRALFDCIRDTILPSLIAARRHRRTLRILSAGCSTGQEPYSLAMLLHDMSAAFEGWQVELIAGDVSDAALDAARQGLYSQSEVQRGLPIRLLLSHFSQDRAPTPAWRIAPHIRDRVSFHPLNLVDDVTLSGEFDLVLCRNVLGAFDPAAKLSALGGLKRITAPDGFLALGAEENMASMAGGFAHVADCAGLYRATRAAPPRLKLVAG